MPTNCCPHCNKPITKRSVGRPQTLFTLEDKIQARKKINAVYYDKHRRKQPQNQDKNIDEKKIEQN